MECLEFRVLPEHCRALDDWLLCVIIASCNYSTSHLYHSVVWEVMKSVIHFSAEKAISVSVLPSKEIYCCGTIK